MAKKLVDNLLYKDLSYKIHGAAIEVRKDFGPGHKEKLYQEAFAKELKRRDIDFEKEKSIKVYSPKDGKFVGLYRPDFIIDGKVMVEIKAEKFVSREEIKRIYDYLRNSEYELAYFVNFASPKLFVRRIIYTNDRKNFYKTLADKKLLVSIGLILVLISGLWAFSVPVSAASSRVYLEAPTEVAVGQEFSVAIFLDSDTRLNAYSFELAYPENVAPTTFDWRGSIAELREDQPRLTEAGRISFEGASLAPFTGKRGKVLTLNFKALAEGSADFRFAKAEVFAADGKGTKIAPETDGAAVLVLGGRAAAALRGAGGAGAPAPQRDNFPPEIKAISWEKDPVDPSRKILGFIVADSGSGVRAVEARTRTFLFWGDWTPVQSPVAVAANAWSLALRATDGAGNTAARTLYDWGAFSRRVLAPGLATVAALVLVFLFLRRRARAGSAAK